MSVKTPVYYKLFRKPSVKFFSSNLKLLSCTATFQRIKVGPT